MEVTVVEGKYQFKIVVNEDSIVNSIRNMKSDFEENWYVWYGSSPEFGEDNFEYITKQEFEKNINQFLNTFMSYITEFGLKDIIARFPRKKNGTFNRRNLVELASCNNCIVIHEWHNTWIYYVVKVVSWDDCTLNIELHKKTDTPG